MVAPPCRRTPLADLVVLRAGALGPLRHPPLVLHEWLPELVASKVFSLAGLPGLEGLMCVAVAALVLVPYLCARRVAESLVAVVLTAFAVVGMSGSLSLRPQLVTFTLSVVFTTAWLASARDLRPRWWLVPLTWLWAL